MNRIEWEQMLHDPTALTRVLEWARSTPVGDIAETHVSHGFAAEPPPHIERPSAVVLDANNRSTVGAPPFHEMAAFLPDIADLGPLEALRALEARFREQPSHLTALLLQSAINRIHAVPLVDDSHRAAVERASVVSQ
jgi:hypothetical protein